MATTSKPSFTTTPEPVQVTQRIGGYDWPEVCRELEVEGTATLRDLLTPDECAALVSLYDHDAIFRKRIAMARHGFGRGEYKYFAYPLPALVQALRAALFPQLSPVANRWNDLMGLDIHYPPDHAAYVERCHEAGQTRPTPLLLAYGPGDYNCLHQDLYGDQLFPLQVTVLLSAPGSDFEGGEFVLTEQRPRMQSRPMVLPLQRGDGVIFPVQRRPMRGTRGVYRVNLRHGVSRVRTGRRYALGLIFHDAT